MDIRAAVTFREKGSHLWLKGLIIDATDTHFKVESFLFGKKVVDLKISDYKWINSANDPEIERILKLQDNGNSTGQAKSI